MLRIGIPRDARWIDIGAGVRLKVRPATTALVTTARTRASRQIERMRQAQKDAQEAGLDYDGPDMTDRDAIVGYAFALSVMSMARELVEDWEGVGDADGTPIPFALDGLGEVLSHSGLAERFIAAVMEAPEALAAEGNG
jgi:hypothetical protein